MLGSLSQRVNWAGNQPISRLMHLALARPELISLAAGFVDQATLPVDSARQAIAAVLDDPRIARAALQYGTTPGLPELRESLLARFLAADGWSAAESRLSAGQVVLTAGSNQLLHLVAEALLDPGDIVLCAAPTYFVFLGVLAQVGARAIGIAADHQGLIPTALEEELKRLDGAGLLSRVKMLYVVSYHDNPSNVTLPADRRQEIVAIIKRWSRHHQIYVVDDAAYRELRYNHLDVPSLRRYDAEGDTVIVAETFSKSFSPGLRVGWGILPTALVEPICELKGNIDFGSASFNQQVMAAVLRLGRFDPHVELLRRHYHAKLEAMLSAAREHLAGIEGVQWDVPQGGLYVWLRLPSWLDAGIDEALFAQALASGVLYVPGEYCYPAEGVPRASHTIRLSFGVQTPEKLREGVAALARAIRSLAAKN